MLTRSQFMHSSAAATLLLAFIGCTNDGTIPVATGTETNPTIACDGVGARSSVVDGHAHDVCVPQNDLKNPPKDGATYTTTNELGHTHTIFIDAPKLSEIDRGEIVRIETSKELGHVHTFALGRPAAFVPPPSGGSSGGTGPAPY
jgi:hypothetical protein